MKSKSHRRTDAPTEVVGDRGGHDPGGGVVEGLADPGVVVARDDKALVEEERGGGV